MDAVTLAAVLSGLDGRLEKLQFSENCNAFVAEYNRLLIEAKKVFANEDYVRTFEQVTPAPEGGSAPVRERTLEEVRMKTNLLKTYVESEVNKQRRRTSVY
jgi:hypothetical protein